MDRKTRSILEELTEVSKRQDRDYMIEATGNNIITSAINFISRIHEVYDDDTALDLERRLFNSIRSGDPKKFERGMKKVKK